MAHPDYAMQDTGEFNDNVASIEEIERLVKNSHLENVSGGLLEASSILKGYEQFEADIIADDAMWSPDAISGKHYDSMMNLQERRNDFFDFMKKDISAGIIASSES